MLRESSHEEDPPRPLDPVHDNAVKLIKRKLKDYDYQAILMPPGTTVEEVIHTALEEKPSAILVSRTLGYQVAETLSRLVDLAEAAGIRQTARLGVGRHGHHPRDRCRAGFRRYLCRGN